MAKEKAGMKHILSKKLIMCASIGLVVGIIMSLLTSVSLVENFELRFLNTLFNIRGQTEVDNQLMVVSVDEKMVKSLGYPVPRLYHALLIKALKELGVKGIGFDVIFDLPSQRPDQDSMLADISAGVENLTYSIGFQLVEAGQKFIKIDEQAAKEVEQFGFKLDPLQSPPHLRRATEDLHPYKLLLDSISSLSHVNLPPDQDGVHRKNHLFVEYNGKFYPSLGLQLALYQLGAGKEDVIFNKEKEIILKTKDKEVSIPLGADGSFLINFRGDDSRYKEISIYEFLQEYKKGNTSFLNEFKDKIILVGQTARAIGDKGPTPYDNESKLVYTHAHVFSNIIHGDFLTRAGRGLQIALLILLSLLVGVEISLLRARFNVPFTLVLLAIYWLFAILMFSGGIWFDLAKPTMAAVLSYLFIFSYVFFIVEKEDRFVKDVFGKYVSAEVLDIMRERKDQFGGVRKELTTLFSDIVSFSKISDQVDPDELVRQLKEYFDEMTRIIFKHEGFLDKFIGDGIMAFWNDPIEREDHILCAVRAAHEMQESMKRMRAKWKEEGKTELHIRIGLNTGFAAVGNLGSTEKFTYTAFGSSVNVASRMESNARPDGVQVTQKIYAIAKKEFDFEDGGEIQVKNIAQPVSVFHLEGLKS